MRSTGNTCLACRATPELTRGTRKSQFHAVTGELTSKSIPTTTQVVDGSNCRTLLLVEGSRVKQLRAGPSKRTWYKFLKSFLVESAKFSRNCSTWTDSLRPVIHCFPFPTSRPPPQRRDDRAMQLTDSTVSWYQPWDLLVQIAQV